MLSLPFGRTTTRAKNGGREVYPLPFREPVSSAPTVALEFHHAAAALRANQVDDRRNDGGVGFAGKRLKKIGMIDLRLLSQVFPRDYGATCSRQLQTEDQFRNREPR